MRHPVGTGGDHDGDGAYQELVRLLCRSRADFLGRQLPGGFQQHAARPGYTAVADAQVLLAAVVDRHHARLAGRVLHPQTGEAGVIDGMKLLIESVSIGAAVPAPIGVIWLVDGALFVGHFGMMARLAALVPFLHQLFRLRIERLRRMVGKRDAQRVLIIHRHPRVPA
jgi:hypothetical protein